MQDRVQEPGPSSGIQKAEQFYVLVSTMEKLSNIPSPIRTTRPSSTVKDITVPMQVKVLNSDPIAGDIYFLMVEIRQIVKYFLS